MATTMVFEVDDEVFEVTTVHDDGAVTVTYYVGRDAYMTHHIKDTHNGPHASANEGRAARESNRTVLLH